MRRMLDPTKVGGLPSTIEFDEEGNRKVGKNLGVDGKLTLKSLVSESNPDGDITKELGGNSERHGYRIIINDTLHYEIYTTKDYNWAIGENIDISSKLWTDNNYKELRFPGTYPASGCYEYDSRGGKALVSIIKITNSGYRGESRYSIKDDSFFSGSISRNSMSAVKLF